jgi:hypothetical protein
LNKSPGAGGKTACPIFSTALIFLASLLIVAGCSILTTRPVQQMSDTSAAIHAAREVQADTLAPDLFREANDWFFKAKHEYQFKNFKFAKEYAVKARELAEQAEYEAIRAGATRSDVAADDPFLNGPSAPEPQQAPPTADDEPYPYPTPTGTPYYELQQQQQQPNQPAQP